MTVRHEKVILDLEDRFTRPMGEAAAAAALLNRELNSLSGSAVKTRSSTSSIDRDVTKLGASAEAGGKQIDKLSGRLALLARAAAVLGPALVPIGAGAIPAISGMATQLTMAAGAAGVTMLAFKGLGEGIKTLNAYQLEPTTENLEKVRLAMEKLGPAGAEFAMFLDAVGPQFRELQMTAREGMFPGMEDGITSLLALLPQVNRIVGEISDAMGSLSAKAGAGLAGERFAEFFDYLESDARPILMEMGRTIGNFADGFASMLVAFAPASADFSSGLERMSKSFADWAHGLDESDSFQSFLDYVRKSGPMVLDLLGSLAEMFAGIVEAAAPVGAAILPALTALADVVGALAATPLGAAFVTAAVAMSAFNSATMLAAKSTKLLGTSMSAGVVNTTALKAAFTTGRPTAEQFGTSLYRAGQAADKQSASTQAANKAVGGFVKAVGPAAAGAGLLAVAMSDVDDKAGLTNTTMGALFGMMAGPWGAAIGATVGLTMDLASANSDVSDELSGLDAAMRSGGAAILRQELVGVREEMEHASGFTHGLAVMWDDLSGRTDKFADAAGRAEERIRLLDDAAGRTEGLDYLLGMPIGLARELDIATDSVEQFKQSFQSLNDLLDRSGSLINYESALDGLTASIKENGNAWEVGTDAGRKNLEARNNLVARAIERSEALKKAGDDLGAQRILDRAIADLESFAGKSPKAQAKIAPFIAELKRLNNTRAEPKVDADTRPAKGKLDQANNWINAWGKTKKEATATVNGAQALSTLFGIDARLRGLQSKTIYVTTVERRVGAGGQSNGFGTYASGGYTGPGGKYEPAGIVHRGEVVIPQERVKRDWSMLKARYGDLPGMATGGLAGNTHNRSGMNFDPLGAAANRATRELHALAGVSKRELNQRQKLLESEVARHKERLDMLKQERQAIVDAVKSAYTSDVFGGSSQQYPDWMDAADIARHEAANRSNALTNDIADMKEALRLLKVLRRRGLNGPAYMDLAATGQVEMLREYVDMSKSELAQFERQYDQRNRLASQLGNYVGDKEYGSDIRDARADRREANRLLSRVESRLEALEEHAKSAPKETGREVGKAVNGAATAGHRGRG